MKFWLKASLVHALLLLQVIDDSFDWTVSKAVGSIFDRSTDNRRGGREEGDLSVVAKLPDKMLRNIIVLRSDIFDERLSELRELW